MAKGSGFFGLKHVYAWMIHLGACLTRAVILLLMFGYAQSNQRNAEAERQRSRDDDKQVNLFYVFSQLHEVSPISR